MEDFDGFTVVKNPGPLQITRELRTKFTGFTYHEGRNQPWAAWYKGLIVYFSADPEEARAMLRRVVPRIRSFDFSRN